MTSTLYPHSQFDKEDVRACLEYALQVRRRVKEQLKKIGGMEFYDVHFSYIDNENLKAACWVACTGQAAQDTFI